MSHAHRRLASGDCGLSAFPILLQSLLNHPLYLFPFLPASMPFVAFVQRPGSGPNLGGLAKRVDHLLGDAIERLPGRRVL